MMTAPDVRASSRVPQLQLVCSVMYLKVFQDSLQGGMKVGGGRLCGGGQAGSVVYLNVFQGLLQGEVGEGGRNYISAPLPWELRQWHFPQRACSQPQLDLDLAVGILPSG